MGYVRLVFGHIANSKGGALHDSKRRVASASESGLTESSCLCGSDSCFTFAKVPGLVLNELTGARSRFNLAPALTGHCEPLPTVPRPALKSSLTLSPKARVIIRSQQAESEHSTGPAGCVHKVNIYRTWVAHTAFGLWHDLVISWNTYALCLLGSAIGFT